MVHSLVKLSLPFFSAIQLSEVITKLIDDITPFIDAQHLNFAPAYF